MMATTCSGRTSIRSSHSCTRGRLAINSQQCHVGAWQPFQAVTAPAAAHMSGDRWCRTALRAPSRPARLRELPQGWSLAAASGMNALKELVVCCTGWYTFRALLLSHMAYAACKDARSSSTEQRPVVSRHMQTVLDVVTSRAAFGDPGEMVHSAPAVSSGAARTPQSRHTGFAFRPALLLSRPAVDRGADASC